MYKQFLNLLVGFLMLVLGAEIQGDELSGRLQKRYFPAPEIVQNPAFGWFVELDQPSQELIRAFSSQLPSDERNYYNIDPKYIQLLVHFDEERARCTHLEGWIVNVQGALEKPVLYQGIRYCRLRIDQLEETLESNYSPAVGQSRLSGHLTVIERYADSVWNPLVSEILPESVLELPAGCVDVPMALRGMLLLRLYPGHPEYGSVEGGDFPGYTWILKLTHESLLKAISTPVSMAFQTPRDIAQFPHYDELDLGSDPADAQWLADHVGREITAQGILFHCHTGHHRNPLLMDVQSLVE